MPINQSKIAPDLPALPIIDEALQQAAQRGPDLALAIAFCAVPRWFDAKVVTGLCPPGDTFVTPASEIFDYLRSLPFCVPHTSRPETWMFQEEVRTYLLAQREVTERWEELQQRAADIFKGRFDARSSKGEGKFADAGLKDLAIEYVYHLNQLDPLKAMEAVRRICAESLAVLTSGGRPEVVFCSRFLANLDWPAASGQIDRELSFLRVGISALSTDNDVKALKMLYELAELPGLSQEQESALRDWIGVIHLRDEGLLAPALKQLTKASELNQKDAIVHAHLAEAYYQPGAIWGRLDLAEHHARKAVEMAQDEPAGYLALGKIAELKENYDEALASYQIAIDKKAEYFDGYLRQSEVYSARGELNRALERIDDALRISPHIKYFAFVRRGNAFRDARRYQEALAEYDKAIAEAPDRIDAYIESGSVQSSLWRVAKAEEAYRKAIELSPDAADGYIALGRLYQAQGKWAKAIQVCQDAKKNEIKFKGLYILLSDLYGEKGRLEDLRQVQEELIQLDTEEEYASHCSIGDAWLSKAWRRSDDDQYRQQWLKDARSEYDKALAIDPNRAWARLSVARLAVLHNDSNIVKEQKRRISEHSPWAEYEMLVSLGRAYLDNFQYAEAEKELQTAVELAPHRIASWQALSELYYQQLDPARVVQTWSKLVDINPTLAYDKHMRAGDAYERIADHERARSEYTQAIEKEPEIYEAYWAMANLAEVEGRLDDAITNYHHVMNNAPGIAATASVRIAEIRLAQGKKNEAEEAVREAILLDSEEVFGYIGLARLGVIERRERLVNEGRQLLESESPEAAERLYDFGNAVGDEYRLAGEDEKAEQAYRECIRRNPERAEAFIGLGQLRLSQGKPQGAEEWLPQALRIDRTNVEAYLAIGTMYERLGKSGEAKQMFRTAITISPWRPEAYIHLCSLLHRCGETEEARKAYQDAKKAYQGDKDAAGVGFLLNLGSYYELQRKMDDALEAYRIGLEYEPTERKPDFLIALAALHARLNNLEQAEVEYRQAIELEPGRAEAYVMLAQLLADKGQLDEAIEVCNQMARQPELAYEAQISIGNLQAAKQQYAEAEAAYRQAIDISPKRIDAYLQLASLCQQQDKLDEAEQLLRQAVQYDSTNAEAYYNLGMIYEQQGVFDHALESYTKATELAPKYGDAYRARGRIYANLKDTKGLDQMVQDILEVGRDDIEKYDVYLLVAETYYTAGLYEQAIDYLNNAVTVDPKRIDAHDALGLTYEAQQRWAEARNEYEKIGQLSPESQTDVHIKLARLFLTEDKPEEAMGEFRKVAVPALDVSDPRLLVLTAGYLDVASGYRKLGKTEAMMEVCGEIVSFVQESHTDDPDVLRHEGLAYLMRGEFAEASRAFRGVLTANPADIKARLYLALSLAAQGELDEAQSQLKQAIGQSQDRADFYYAIIEAEVLAEREIVGAKSIQKALREASEKAAQ